MTSSNLVAIKLESGTMKNNCKLFFGNLCRGIVAAISFRVIRVDKLWDSTVILDSTEAELYQIAANIRLSHTI